MKLKAWLTWITLALGTVFAYGQTDKMIHVKMLPRTAVAQKVDDAMLTCPRSPSPCNLVADASLVETATGSMSDASSDAPAPSSSTVLDPAPGTGTISAALAPYPGGSVSVRLQCGTYKDNIVLNNASGVEITGGASGYGVHCTKIVPNISANPVIEIKSTGSGSGASFIGLRNLWLQCPAGTACGDGLYITGYNGASQGAEFLNVEDVSVTGDANSATTGFNYGVDIDGGLISATFRQMYINNGRSAAFIVRGSSPINDVRVLESTFQQSYGYGAYWHNTNATPNASITFMHDVFQYNGYNSSGVGVGETCAGLYVNGAYTVNIKNNYFEGNCKGNTSGRPVADIRLGGTFDQAASIEGNSFFQDWDEWGIYTSASETTGVYQGNNFSSSAKSIYVGTTHSESDVSIGPNFNAAPTIVPDPGGATHVADTGRLHQDSNFSVDAAAGSGATVNCISGYVCDSSHGAIQVHTGSSASAGDGVTITWSNPMPSIPVCIVREKAGAPGQVWADKATTKSLAIYASWSSSSTYSVTYQCAP